MSGECACIPGLRVCNYHATRARELSPLLDEMEAIIRALAHASNTTPHLVNTLRDKARLLVAQLDAAHLPRRSA